ncbi:MAG TPA: hypothetical protein V6D23_07790, partial [Candidatus Obscuribacterales bacterium]
MRKIRLKDRFRYQFDKLMSKGTITLIAGLFLLSAGLIAVVSLGVHITGIVPLDNGREPDVLEIMWMSLMRTLDGGTMGNDKGSWPFLLAMLFVTSAGILFISTLTGILTSGIQRKMEVMRKGRSFVVEKDHIVILGWSSQVFPIISELAYANQHNPGFCIAILADKDKVEMEDEIHLKIKHHKGARVVCRSGDPLDLHTLEIVNPHRSRAIIILAPESGNDPDSDVIKTILAITNNPQRRPEPYHIVAAVREAKNLSVARMVGQDEVEVVLTNQFISRLAVQTCRQPGLSVVYHEILDFKGDDVYFKQEAALVGKSFREAAFAYQKSAVMGLRLKDGRILLNPPAETLIAEGDKIVALSESNATVLLSLRRDFQINRAALVVAEPRPKRPEKILLLGWNQNTTTVINELDAYVAAGSAIRVIADLPQAEAELARNCHRLQHLSYTFTLADSSDREVLEHVQCQDYDYIMTMAYSGLFDTQQADART